MINCKIEKLKIKLVAAGTFINVAPLTNFPHYTLFCYTHYSNGVESKESCDLRTQTRSVGDLMVMIFLVKTLNTR